MSWKPLLVAFPFFLYEKREMNELESFFFFFLKCMQFTLNSWKTLEEEGRGESTEKMFSKMRVRNICCQ